MLTLKQSDYGLVKFHFVCCRDDNIYAGHAVTEEARAGQLSLLIFLGFVAGYFLSDARHMPSDKPLYGYGLSILFIGALIYRAIKFYQTIK